MKVELSSDTSQWVQAELATGRFATAEAAIHYAVNYTKLAHLRAELELAEAEGGAFDSAEIKRFTRDHLDRLAEGRDQDD